MTDGILVERALSGDLEGFGELHRRYYRRVVRIVSGIIKDAALAEDLVQEAYVSALKDLPRLSDPERFYPWLCRIAVNRSIEELRKMTRRARFRGEWVADPSRESESSAEPDALDGIVNRERSETVRAALHHLPERQRAAVILRFFDDLPMKTIAEILGCEEVTARTQVFRGVRRLGAILKQDEVQP